jgi:hypothetical protein
MNNMEDRLLSKVNGISGEMAQLEEEISMTIVKTENKCFEEIKNKTGKPVSNVKMSDVESLVHAS